MKALHGKGKIVSQAGIAEVRSPSMKALEACAASNGGKQTIAHAVSISYGGAPTILVAEDETLGTDERR